MTTDVLKITRLNSGQSDFEEQLSALLAWDSVSDQAVVEIVDEIEDVDTRPTDDRPRV